MRFRFHLARDLHMTVEELAHRMSIREYRQWAALYKAEAQERAEAEKEAQA